MDKRSMTINRDLVYSFTRFGMGEGPQELQRVLAGKLLTLTLDSGILPSKVLFYTDGVRLACQGSPVLEQLKQLEANGVELVLCSTCLETYQLRDKVEVGIVGGMGDILQVIQQAGKVVSL